MYYIQQSIFTISQKKSYENAFQHFLNCEHVSLIWILESYVCCIKNMCSYIFLWENIQVHSITWTLFLESIKAGIL